LESRPALRSFCTSQAFKPSQDLPKGGVCPLRFLATFSPARWIKHEINNSLIFCFFSLVSRVVPRAQEELPLSLLQSVAGHTFLVAARFRSATAIGATRRRFQSMPQKRPAVPSPEYEPSARPGHPAGRSTPPRGRAGSSLAGDDAGIAIVVPPGERKGCVDNVRCEPFAGGAVVRTDTVSLICRKSGGTSRLQEMVKTVEDVQLSVRGLLRGVDGEFPDSVRIPRRGSRSQNVLHFKLLKVTAFEEGSL
jgi:hypothetical protein